MQDHRGPRRPPRRRSTPRWAPPPWGALLLAACATTVPIEEATFAPEVNVNLDAMERSASGLYTQDLAEGDGPEAGAGDRVAIHYVGWLADGTPFDALVPPEEPAEFEVGAGDVVGGLDEGVVGMRPGGQRRLVVPPGLGYGSLGAGTVPPNAVLVFVVDLVEIRRFPTPSAAPSSPAPPARSPGSR